MHIGIPREIKPLEGRIALSPEACGDLVHAGHTVTVEHNAGNLSGYLDAQYEVLGVSIAADASTTYGQAELIVKVKEPVTDDLALLRKDHLLFCFLHLAANPALARRLQDIGLTAVGFETVAADNGNLPLLAPMSDIAGRLATQIGTSLLHQPQGGKGLLLGGLPGTERGRVVIIGAGNAGGNAAAMAAAIGAEVVVFDLQRERLAAMRTLGNNVTGLYPYKEAIKQAVATADLLIGATLNPGNGHRTSSPVTWSIRCSRVVSLWIFPSTRVAASRQPGLPTTKTRPMWMKGWYILQSPTCPAPCHAAPRRPCLLPYCPMYSH